MAGAIVHTMPARLFSPSLLAPQVQIRFLVRQTRPSRAFTSSLRARVEGREINTEQGPDSSITAAGHDSQHRTPWHRSGADVPPVEKVSNKPMIRGKLLTTPSRLLKLVIPVAKTDEDDIEPLALLVHPQQPLSYLERLVQSELPTIKDKNGNEKIPSVYFKAEDAVQDDDEGSGRKKKPRVGEKAGDDTQARDEQDDDGPLSAEDIELRRAEEQEKEEAASLEDIKIEGKSQKTGIISKKAYEQGDTLRGGPGEGGVEHYGSLGQSGPSSGVPFHDKRLVRWSKSTDIGDFIRDAARGKEFAIEIDGRDEDILVGVPSFDDRTHYLRLRLGKTSRKMTHLADIKTECDKLAKQSADRWAIAGAGGLITWFGAVAYLTFGTGLGWDYMEPITYLVGLATLIGGYFWFLYHQREISYKSAMHITFSRKQQQLYHEKGFDLRRWDALAEEANLLRKEIKIIADEYDVEWEEGEVIKNEKVTEALRKERKKKSEKEKDEDDDDEEESKEQEKKNDKKDEKKK